MLVAAAGRGHDAAIVIVGQGFTGAGAGSDLDMI